MQKFKNPDLYFSRGEVHSYLEKYKEAVSDYLTAHQIDPTLGGKAMSDNIKTFVIKTASLINKKARADIKTLIGRTEAQEGVRDHEDYLHDLRSSF